MLVRSEFIRGRRGDSAIVRDVLERPSGTPDWLPEPKKKRIGGHQKRARSTSTHQRSDSMTCVHIDSGRSLRDSVPLRVTLESPVLSLLGALLRIGRGTGQGRPAPGFGAKSSQRHPTQHRCPHRFGTIPPGSRRSDGVSNELYLQFISGTPVVRYREAGKRTSEPN